MHIQFSLGILKKVRENHFTKNYSKFKTKIAYDLNEFIIYQSSKFSFSCVSLVESVSREIDEIRLSPSHQRAREIMLYSPVNNKKITCAITAENHECFVNDILYRIRFKVFCVSTVDVSLGFASGNIDSLGSTKHTVSLSLSQ